MQAILIFVLVVLLLAADAFIFFAVGTAYMTGKTIADRNILNELEANCPLWRGPRKED